MSFIEITGFDEAADQVKEMLESMKDQVIRGVQEIGKQAFGVMESNSPVLTGFLKSRWTYQDSTLGFVITNDCPYVGFVEFGTSRMPPHNFVTPAYEAMRADIDSLIRMYSKK